MPPTAVNDLADNNEMYIVAIGWLYATLLIAINEPGLVAGLVSFAFYGLLPCGLLLYFSGTRVRRERQRYRELLANQPLRNDDGADPETDQQDLLERLPEGGAPVQAGDQVSHGHVDHAGRREPQ